MAPGRAIRRPVAVCVVALAIALVGAGCFSGSGSKAGGEGQKHAIVLTLANHEDGDGDVGEFARAVSRLSGGSMRIEITSRWRDKEVDYDRGTVADVRAGKVDLAKIGVRSFDTLGVRSFQALMAPLLVDSVRLEGRVLASPVARKMLAGARRLGVEGIAMLPGDARRPFGISRRLLAPSDYRGATIGIRPSLVSSWTFQALGATARSYVPGDLPPSFDGAELDLATIQGNVYDGPGTSLTANVVLWPRAFAVVMNKKTFDRLTRKQQATLLQAGREALAPALDRLRAENRVASGILCRRGGMRFLDATPAQLASLRAAVRSVYAQLEDDTETRSFLDEIEGMKQGLAQEKPPSCAGGTSAGRRATPLDGVYEVVTSEADQRAVGGPAGDVIPENWGHWVYVFHGGHLAFTQENAEACTWAYGKLTVSGNSMAWTIVDGGYTKAPNQAYNKPGEFFRFLWSLYRDTLTLTPIEGAISPENFRVKPWHRLSATPSEKYFSKRCPPPQEALP